MNKTFTAGLLAILLSGASGCTSFYQVTKETPPTRNLADYKQIHIGWLDLREDDWQKYEFESKEIWSGEIHKHNVEGLQVYMKENLGERILGGAQSRQEPMPEQGDLFIKLTFDRIDQNYNGWGALDEMFLNVEFIDIASKEPVYKASLVTNQAGVFPRNWKGSSFDGRLDNEIFNLATLLAEKLK